MGKLGEPAPLRFCSHCKETRKLADFNWSNKPKGLRDTWCRFCRAAWAKEWRKKPEVRAKQRQFCRNRYKRDPEKILVYNRKSRIKAKYGMTVAERDRLFADEGATCRTCGTPFQGTIRKCMDHCHATGQVRGVLCNRCNTALGYAQDRVDVLNNLALYLQGLL